MSLGKWVRDQITERDNSTICPIRVVGAGVFSIYHAAVLAGVAVHSIPLDITSAGEYLKHMMAFMGTLGFSVGTKSMLGADAK